MSTRDDTKIWRYLDLGRFISLITTNSLHLTRLDSFEDKWEGTWPRKLLERAKKESLDPAEFTALTKQVRKSMYVSCWHRSEHESAALWDLYASKSGLAIQSTLGRLKASISEDPDNYLVDEVKYVNFDAGLPIEELNFFRLPFMKRMSFEHERELRILRWDISALGGDAHEGGLLPHRAVDVDLATLIQTVYVSPAAGAWLATAVESLCRRFELPTAVQRSNLYDERIW